MWRNVMSCHVMSVCLNVIIYMVVDLKVHVRSFNCESRALYVGKPRESFFDFAKVTFLFAKNGRSLIKEFWSTTIYINVCVCFSCLFFVDGLPLWKDWRAWGDTGGGVRVSAQCRLWPLCSDRIFPSRPFWEKMQSLAKGTRRISLHQRNDGATGLFQWWYDKDTRPLGPWDRPWSWHTGRLTRNDKDLGGPDKDVKLKIKSFLQIVSTCFYNTCI
jgi:hypothetical protein